MPRTTGFALAGATAWSLALVVAALTVPVYSGTSAATDAAGTFTRSETSATLVAVNGWWGLVVAAVPLVACVAVAGLLRRGRRHRSARFAALGIVALVGVGAVLSVFTVGLFVAPAVAALGVAVLADLSRPADGAQRARGDGDASERGGYADGCDGLRPPA